MLINTCYFVQFVITTDHEVLLLVQFVFPSLCKLAGNLKILVQMSMKFGEKLGNEPGNM